ncbi:MAG: hypothetical protein ACK56F_10035, partial [bacterium]
YLPRDHYTFQDVILWLTRAYLFLHLLDLKRAIDVADQKLEKIGVIDRFLFADFIRDSCDVTLRLLDGVDRFAFVVARG